MRVQQDDNMDIQQDDNINAQQPNNEGHQQAGNQDTEPPGEVVQINMPIDDNELIKMQAKDPQVQAMINLLAHDTLPEKYTKKQCYALLGKRKDFVIHNEKLYMISKQPNGEERLKFVVPKMMQDDVFKSCHDDPLAAHLGFYQNI